MEPQALLKDVETALDVYNLRRWLAWLLGFGSVVYGGFLLADVGGALIGFGTFCLAIALSQEIRAAVHPIGIVAIEEFVRRR